MSDYLFSINLALMAIAGTGVLFGWVLRGIVCDWRDRQIVRRIVQIERTINDWSHK